MPPVLASFVDRHTRGAEIDEVALGCGAWLSVVERLLDGAARPPMESNGAEQAVAAILRRVPIS
jgi:hypothetical protein